MSVSFSFIQCVNVNNSTNFFGKEKKLKVFWFTRNGDKRS